MLHITLGDLKNSSTPDCCQAMDFIKHHFTPGLPHERTPQTETHNFGKKTNKEKLKDSTIQRTIDNFVNRQFTRDWR